MCVENLKTVEQNHLAHFVFLPEKLGFEVINIDGIAVINCSLKTSMFNIAYGSPQTLEIADAIDEIKQEFAGCPFAWWIPPSRHHPAATKAILESGLEIETTEYAMVCDLCGFDGHSTKKQI